MTNEMKERLEYLKSQVEILGLSKEEKERFEKWLVTVSDSLDFAESDNTKLFDEREKGITSPSMQEIEDSIDYNLSYLLENDENYINALKAVDNEKVKRIHTVIQDMVAPVLERYVDEFILGGDKTALDNLADFFGWKTDFITPGIGGHGRREALVVNAKSFLGSYFALFDNNGRRVMLYDDEDKPVDISTVTISEGGRVVLEDEKGHPLYHVWQVEEKDGALDKVKQVGVRGVDRRKVLSSLGKSSELFALVEVYDPTALVDLLRDLPGGDVIYDYAFGEDVSDKSIEEALTSAFESIVDGLEKQVEEDTSISEDEKINCIAQIEQLVREERRFDPKHFNLEDAIKDEEEPKLKVVKNQLDTFYENATRLDDYNNALSASKKAFDSLKSDAVKYSFYELYDKYIDKGLADFNVIRVRLKQLVTNSDSNLYGGENPLVDIINSADTARRASAKGLYYAITSADNDTILETGAKLLAGGDVEKFKQMLEEHVKRVDNSSGKPLISATRVKDRISDEIRELTGKSKLGEMPLRYQVESFIDEIVDNKSREYTEEYAIQIAKMDLKARGLNPDDPNYEKELIDIAYKITGSIETEQKRSFARELARRRLEQNEIKEGVVDSDTYRGIEKKIIDKISEKFTYKDGVWIAPSEKECNKILDDAPRFNRDTGKIEYSIGVTEEKVNKDGATPELIEEVEEILYMIPACDREGVARLVKAGKVTEIPIINLSKPDIVDSDTSGLSRIPTKKVKEEDKKEEGKKEKSETVVVLDTLERSRIAKEVKKEKAEEEDKKIKPVGEEKSEPSFEEKRNKLLNAVDERYVEVLAKRGGKKLKRHPFTEKQYVKEFEDAFVTRLANLYRDNEVKIVDMDPEALEKEQQFAEKWINEHYLGPKECAKMRKRLEKNKVTAEERAEFEVRAQLLNELDGRKVSDLTPTQKAWVVRNVNNKLKARKDIRERFCERDIANGSPLLSSIAGASKDKKAVSTSSGHSGASFSSTDEMLEWLTKAIEYMDGAYKSAGVSTQKRPETKIPDKDKTPAPKEVMTPEHKTKDPKAEEHKTETPKAESKKPVPLGVSDMARDVVFEDMWVTLDKAFKTKSTYKDYVGKKNLAMVAMASGHWPDDREAMAKYGMTQKDLLDHMQKQYFDTVKNKAIRDALRKGEIKLESGVVVTEANINSADSQKAIDDWSKKNVGEIKTVDGKPVVDEKTGHFIIVKGDKDVDGSSKEGIFGGIENDKSPLTPQGVARYVVNEVLKGQNNPLDPRVGDAKLDDRRKNSRLYNMLARAGWSANISDVEKGIIEQINREATKDADAFAMATGTGEETSRTTIAMDDGSEKEVGVKKIGDKEFYCDIETGEIISCKNIEERSSDGIVKQITDGLIEKYDSEHKMKSDSEIAKAKDEISKVELGL